MILVYILLNTRKFETVLYDEFISLLQACQVWNPSDELAKQNKFIMEYNLKLSCISNKTICVC